MQDPTRIPPVAALLQRAWEAQPQLGFAEFFARLAARGIARNSSDAELADALRAELSVHPWSFEGGVTARGAGRRTGWAAPRRGSVAGWCDQHHHRPRPDRARARRGQHQQNSGATRHDRPGMDRGASRLDAQSNAADSVALRGHPTLPPRRTVTGAQWCTGWALCGSSRCSNPPRGTRQPSWDRRASQTNQTSAA